jgi:hypothetical protein
MLKLINKESEGELMGRTKKGNANAQRNNNAKRQGKDNHPETGFESYAEREAEKMNRNQHS